MAVGLAKTQISLGIRLVWSESDAQTDLILRCAGRMPRLIWVFAGHTVILCHEVAQTFSDFLVNRKTYKPRHDKTNKMAVGPAKTQISLGNRPVWSESDSSLCWADTQADLSLRWAHNHIVMRRLNYRSRNSFSDSILFGHGRNTFPLPAHI